MRNLILSAFPSNMKLIDPFTPDLKIELLKEIEYSPIVKSNYISILLSGKDEAEKTEKENNNNNNNFKNEIDKFLLLNDYNKKKNNDHNKKK
ncbi:ccr4-not transcription complex [Anaeramoeba flamelloides]|uniref:Ccr4-not transcription complex n=1 Tax=Anaeramoeba flamelloides TaxID=1746091 RepID=A0AAV8AB17_9EUKA|nr:ccr4-not transcription complex [Anaeramoeba flamelloides]